MITAGGIVVSPLQLVIGTIVFILILTWNALLVLKLKQAKQVLRKLYEAQCVKSKS